MDRTAWQKKHSGWVWGGSACSALAGMTAGKQVGHGWITGLFVAVIVAIIVAILIPYAAWFFASDGPKALEAKNQS